jgi:general secretion pathway protein A
MYKSFFGLRANPFNVNPDPRFLFYMQETRETLASLSYGIQNRKGFVQLTGEVGTGKTTVLNKVLEWLRTQRVCTAFIFNPRLSVTEFFDCVMADFGIHCESRDKSIRLLRLNTWLLERYRAGELACLVIDEAQALSVELLEEIRLLTNLETPTTKLLQIILSGQPELEEKLRDPQLRQFRQRITLRCRIYPLSLEQTRSYVRERLRIAGANGQPIFSVGALDAIHQYSQGIPRVINLLCEHSLINSFVDQRKVVISETVDMVAREFELHEVGPMVTQKRDGESKSVVAGLKVLANIREPNLHPSISGAPEVAKL